MDKPIRVAVSLDCGGLNRVFSSLMVLRLVLEDQKYLQRTELLALVRAAFVLGHEDHEPSLPSIPDSNVGLQRCVHAGFLQNDGAGMLWNGGVQDIWTSPDSFAQEFFLVFWK